MYNAFWSFWRTHIYSCMLIHKINGYFVVYLTFYDSVMSSSFTSIESLLVYHRVSFINIFKILSTMLVQKKNILLYFSCYFCMLPMKVVHVYESESKFRILCFDFISKIKIWKNKIKNININTHILSILIHIYKLCAFLSEPEVFWGYIMH